MLTRDDFAAACRALDGLVAGGSSIDRILYDSDVDPQGAAHVAHQRALRAALVGIEGWTLGQVEEAARVKRRLDLSPEPEAAVPFLAAMWLEGLAVGRRTRPRPRH